MAAWAYLFTPAVPLWPPPGSGHACLHTCSVLASTHGGVGGPIWKSAESQCHRVLAQPHLFTPVSHPSANTLWHRHPVLCTRHACHIPVLHSGSRDKTIHILAPSCTSICGLGVPVPTHCFPGPLCSGFGMPVCTLAKVPAPHTHVISQSLHVEAQACLFVHLLCVPVLLCAAWECLLAYLRYI